MELKYYVYELIDYSTNLPFYIGKGTNDRMYYHEQVVKRGGHLSNEKLNKKISNLLKENIEIKYNQVYFTDDNNEAYEKETELIREIGLENLCNLTEVAWPPTMTEESRKKISKSRKGKSSWNKGIPCSEKTRKKLREANKGKNIGDLNPAKRLDVREKIGRSHKGKIVSEETKEKIRKKLKGRKQTEETKRKISKTCKGKIVSKETRQKLSKSSKNHIVTEETKRKISKGNKGNKNSLNHKHSDESKRKISESRKGKTYEEILSSKEKSEEVKEKISIALKGRIPWNKGKKYLRKNKKVLEIIT